MSKTVVFEVGMTCGGCSAAVTRILKKVEGEIKCMCTDVAQSLVS